LAAISRTASLLPSLVVSCLVVSACHRTAPLDVLTATGRCTSHVRSKGQLPQLPVDPPLRSGYGGVIGTLADSGGALPHYVVLASSPGDAPDSPHASATADSAGGFVFGSMPPGRYLLLVHPYEHRPDSATVDIVAGRVDTVRLVTQYFQCVR
jgi:hypothetical protein